MPLRGSTSWVREHTHLVRFTDGATTLPGALWESFSEEAPASTECRIHIRACRSGGSSAEEEHGKGTVDYE